MVVTTVLFEMVGIGLGLKVEPEEPGKELFVELTTVVVVVVLTEPD